jgi:hypothetical protein
MIMLNHGSNSPTDSREEPKNNPFRSEADLLRDWNKALKELEDQNVSELEKAIKDDFRKLLGV